MRARLAFLCLVAAVCPGVGHAGAELQIFSNYALEQPEDARKPPKLKGRFTGASGAFYGGLRGNTIERHDAAANVFVGFRPQVGPMSLDLGYQRQVVGDEADRCCGRVAVGLGRALGGGGRISANVSVDPTTSRARTEAKARFQILPNTEVVAEVSSLMTSFDASQPENLTLNLAGIRRLRPGATVRFAYKGVESGMSRAAVTLNFDFGTGPR